MRGVTAVWRVQTNVHVVPHREAAAGSHTRPWIHVEAEPGLDMGATSKKLAEMWKAATDEEKALYQVLTRTRRRL